MPSRPAPRMRLCDSTGIIFSRGSRFAGSGNGPFTDVQQGEEGGGGGGGGGEEGGEGEGRRGQASARRARVRSVAPALRSVEGAYYRGGVIFYGAAPFNCIDVSIDCARLSFRSRLLSRTPTLVGGIMLVACVHGIDLSSLCRNADQSVRERERERERGRERGCNDRGENESACGKATGRSPVRWHNICQRSCNPCVISVISFLVSDTPCSRCSRSYLKSASWRRVRRASPA